MKIPVANLYYLLSYAWQRLPESGVGGVTGDDANHLVNLFARFLSHGFLRLARRGIDRGYVQREGESAALRGRGLWVESERRLSHLRGRIYCRFDELDADTPINRVLKSAFSVLRRDRALAPDLRRRINLCLGYLGPVPERPFHESQLRGIQIHSGLREYAWIIDACRLLLRWSLPDPSGVLQFREVLEDEVQMRLLFQDFVRGFFLLEQTDYAVAATALQWPWQAADELSKALLPRMITDTTLSRGQERIVIETKFTPKIVTEKSDRYPEKFQSDHLFQLHAYLSALADEGMSPLRGILLYPRVEHEVRAAYAHARYSLEVRTVNLSAPWKSIHSSLLELLQPGSALRIRSSGITSDQSSIAS